MEIHMNAIAELYYLEKLNDESLAKKQNILRLALAFNKYFMNVSCGTLWEDCCSDVQQDIKNIRKWDRKNKKSIISAIKSIKNAVVDQNGSVPDHFLIVDSIDYQANILTAQNAPYIAELSTAGYDKAVKKIIKPILPINRTHGTATQYVSMFNNIQNYYEKLLNQR